MFMTRYPIRVQLWVTWLMACCDWLKFTVYFYRRILIYRRRCCLPFVSRYVTLWQGEGYSILKYKYYDRKSTDSHRWIFCCWFICYSYMRCWQWLLECLLQNKPSQGETQVHISWDTFTSDFRSLSAGWARPLRTSQSSAETLTRILVTMRLPTQTSRGSWSVQC